MWTGPHEHADQYAHEHEHEHADENPHAKT
jgi:hypothetical protein